MKKLDAVALLLAIVGALNWGLVALAGSTWWRRSPASSSDERLPRVIYGLVGLSGLWLAARSFELVRGRDRQVAGVV